MNKNIDLTKILKDCPSGTKLYSSTFGQVEFQYIIQGALYPIVIKLKNGVVEKLTSNGVLFSDGGGECILFPSKEQRDWSKFTAPWYKKDRFDPNTLKPFDKVLIRDSPEENWCCGFFSRICNDIEYYQYITTTSGYNYCIPYNDDTKHLVGIANEAPEYYRYWEN